MIIIWGRFRNKRGELRALPTNMDILFSRMDVPNLIELRPILIVTKVRNTGETGDVHRYVDFYFQIGKIWDFV